MSVTHGVAGVTEAANGAAGVTEAANRVAGVRAGCTVLGWPKEWHCHHLVSWSCLHQWLRGPRAFHTVSV